LGLDVSSSKKKVIGFGWVYTIQRKLDEFVEHYKASLFAKGFS